MGANSNKKEYICKLLKYSSKEFEINLIHKNLYERKN